MLQMHMVFRVNFAPKYTSKASTPFHKSCNSSIKSSKYTSTLLDVQDSLPRIIKAKLKKRLLVTNHGGKTTSHVEWHELRSPKRFTPSSAKPQPNVVGVYNKFWPLSCYVFSIFGI